MARNPDLEAAILAAPDDHQAYVVYADWLQSQGDPRGELGILQHRESEAAAALLAKHAAQILGRFATETPETFQLTWRCGFIETATIGWEMFSEIDEDDPPDAQLTAFLELEAARLVEKLVLGPVGGEEELDNGVLANAIEQVQPPNLKSLYLGDIADWDISSTATRIPRSETILGLRELTLCGGNVTLDTIELPELRSFTVRSGSLTESELHAIAAAHWPQLERLEIWFGDPNYGASGSAEDIAAIFDARGLGALRHLALRNCPFADELVGRLVPSKVLRQVETLDLSMGNLSDRGITAMLATADAFTHLANLDISDNALTTASWPAARALAKTVVFGDRHRVERAVPRQDGNRYFRYVTVGE